MKNERENKMNYLSEFRKQEKLSQTELSRLLEISKSHYIKIELGTRNPSFNFLKKLKKVFPKVDLNEIVK